MPRLRSTPRDAFRFCTYEGALNAARFVDLLERMMRDQQTPVHLVVDGLPAHQTDLVKQYVATTQGRLTLHVLPCYAPELNPDERVWSHVKRTGTAKRPLRKGDNLRDKIEEQLARLQQMPHLIRSFFKAPSLHSSSSSWPQTCRPYSGCRDWPFVV